MSERGQTTEDRDWPWDRPHSHEADVLETDLRIDAWTLHAIRGIGVAVAEVLEQVTAILATQRTMSRRLTAIEHGQENIVANKLDPITASIAAGRAATQAEHDEVAAALAALSDKATALQATIDGMVADTVTQAEIDAAAADAGTLVTDIQDIYTAPVVEPPVV